MQRSDRALRPSPAAGGAQPARRRFSPRGGDAPPSADTARRERRRRLEAVIAALAHSRTAHHGRG